MQKPLDFAKFDALTSEPDHQYTGCIPPKPKGHNPQRKNEHYSRIFQLSFTIYFR